MLRHAPREHRRQDCLALARASRIDPKFARLEAAGSHVEIGQTSRDATLTHLAREDRLSVGKDGVCRIRGLKSGLGVGSGLRHRLERRNRVRGYLGRFTSTGTSLACSIVAYADSMISRRAARSRIARA